MLPYYYNPFHQPGRSSISMPQVQPAQIQQPMPVQQPMPIQQPVQQPVQQPANEQFPIMENQEMVMPEMQQPLMPEYFPENVGNQPMQPIEQMENIQPLPEQIMPGYMENLQPNLPMQNMPYMGNMQPNLPMQNMPYMGNIPYSPLDSYMPYTNPIGRQLQPIISDNPAVIRVSAFKELTGYPNYGNPSGNADILYTGTRGTWTINIPAFLTIPGNLNAQLVIRAILDDTDTPADRYSATITVNGATVHTGRVNLPHGRPFGQRFTNWVDLTFNVRNIRRNNRIVIANTSRNTPENSWIGIDWIEMRLTPR